MYNHRIVSQKTGLVLGTNQPAYSPIQRGFRSRDVDFTIQPVQGFPFRLDFSVSNLIYFKLVLRLQNEVNGHVRLSALRRFRRASVGGWGVRIPPLLVFDSSGSRLPFQSNRRALMQAIMSPLFLISRRMKIEDGLAWKKPRPFHGSTDIGISCSGSVNSGLINFVQVAHIRPVSC
jgi:hypothetical protein